MHDEQRWYKIGFDQACLAGNAENPPKNKPAKIIAAYERGFRDRRALDQKGA